MKVFLYVTVIILAFAGCQSKPTQESLAGSYEVSFDLKNKEKLKEDIKKTIDSTTKDVKVEFSKDDVLNEEIDLSAIDTTTPEGRIEYAAQMMGKEFAKAGKTMGKEMAEMGGLFGNLGTGLVDGLGTMLEGQRFDVELQADGDVKIKGLGLFAMAMSEVRWSVTDNDLIITDVDGKEISRGTIIPDGTGFTIEQKELLVRFVKKK